MHNVDEWAPLVAFICLLLGIPLALVVFARPHDANRAPKDSPKKDADPKTSKNPS